MEWKNFLITFVGLPGIGKTKVRNEILTYLERELYETPFVYSTDDYIQQLANIRGDTYNETFSREIGLATKHMNEMLDEAIKNEEDIIWDQTNLSAKKRKKIVRKFGKQYWKGCVWFDIPREHTKAYLHYRQLNERGDKHIPNKVIDDMKDSFVEPDKKEGWDYVSSGGYPGENTFWIEHTMKQIFGL